MRANTVQVRFEDVGRGHKTWSDDVREDPAFPGTPDADCLVRALKKGRALMSRDLNVSVNDDGTAGLCFAGMHTVGRWTLLAAAPRETGKE